MGKTLQTKKTKLHHPDPLGEQFRESTVQEQGYLSAPGRRSDKLGKKRDKRVNDDAAGGNSTDARLSKKIFDIARLQQDEEDSENEELPAEKDQSSNRKTTGSSAFDQFRDGDDLEMEDEEDEDNDFEKIGGPNDEDEVDYAAELDVDEQDQAALDAFNGGGNAFSNIVFKKLSEQDKNTLEDDSKPIGPNFDPKVVEVYTKIGQLLTRYRTGPLPKAFKVLPVIPAWQEIIVFTNPEEWTHHAMYAAVRLFASNLKPKECQKFYRDYLLPHVRREIMDDKKVSVHTYNALKKAMFKPAAFFKGILFQLCSSGTCTLKEAIVVGSVLSKIKVPVEHSGAALLKLAEMDYTGPNSLFIRILLDKKYALPYKVVDSLVFHFIRFKRDPRQLPVLWHQSLLVFVQRYKADLTQEQKDAIMDLARHKVHDQITPEVRREIVHSVARGEEVPVEDDNDVMVF